MCRLCRRLHNYRLFMSGRHALPPRPNLRTLPAGNPSSSRPLPTAVIVAASPASAAVSAMLRSMVSGTYQRKIDPYIALTEFARGKFCEGGLPRQRIVVKPNFLATTRVLAVEPVALRCSQVADRRERARYFARCVEPIARAPFL